MPRESWSDEMVPLVDFLDVEPADREGRFLYIWAVEKNNPPTIA